MNRLLAPLLVLSFFLATVHQGKAAEAATNQYDIVVYGGTSAGVIAAVQAKKMGKSVVIVGPDKHLGGLTSGGLGWTDTGNKSVIGGLARDFYHRIWKAYQHPAAWPHQPQTQYGNKGQGTLAIDGENRTMWIFEPHVAEQVYEDYVREFEIPVFRDEYLDRESGVTMKDGRIVGIRMLSGKSYAGKMFIDATYEGDLMASAGVTYHVGREAAATYGERFNGVQTGVLHHAHHFGILDKPVSPYVVPGDPASGVLPRVSAQPPGEKFAGDHRVQAYCFRMCLTNHEPNRVPFAKPAGYDPSQYELLVRIFDAGFNQTFAKFDPIPNYKTDTNNHGPMSTDNIGFNYDYPEASYERRREIIKEHETYQQGWLYFIANDPRVPEQTRQQMRKWGLAKDEFVDNGNWPHQLYIREARRMVGDFVMTENELLKRSETPESVGMGSYTMDSHNVQRYITPEGHVQNEGDIGVSTKGPYQIAYGSLVPKKSECENLLVPVCVSSSHIAFGSIRMEPVFMILGHSSATAAVMAIDEKIAVQDVDYEKLSQRLRADGQVLEYSGSEKRTTGKGVSSDQLKGIVVDDAKAEFTGTWLPSTSSSKFVDHGYVHDGHQADGLATMTFTATLPKAGEYEVRVAYPANSNRASNVKITVHHAAGSSTVSVNQKETPAIEGLFVSLGKFPFDANAKATVRITNDGANGHVVADAVQWLP
ncbi:Xanthan lyase precursor [Novipirellula galeiformis]|uniref:Xanthan lyase n=1 Tax=Novipirellula galeiformis TaxID=2528004 RepID=A0A5C6CK97_9BACT|nr:FAD-dependent oxidoreductase [Novipirellula galeiformis]TWU24017.1 Xanthan lyase precursor [Novipirellula galeiformis]